MGGGTPGPGDVADLVALRQRIHSDPELGYDEHRTADLVARQLRALGLDVHVGIGGTGVVGVLRRGAGPRTIGLRADMDALAMDERGTPAYRSRNPGVFHGCGHDGHVAMLLGAARTLAARQDFDGTVAFIFQPAEEGLAGARRMIEDGLFERFPCDHVFALHNWPDLPAGVIATRPGPIMAAADRFRIRLAGRGGHAAMPQKADDLPGAAAQLVTQLNAIVSRRIPAGATAVLSVTQLNCGTAHNVLPAEAEISGTVRTFDEAIQDRIERAIRTITAGVAAAAGVEAEIVYDRYYPATVNDAAAAAVALEAAAAVGEARLAAAPAFTSEDFAFMLRERPGAYIWLGQGGGGVDHPLHHPHYDFNDAILALGIDLHVELVRRMLAPGAATDDIS